MDSYENEASKFAAQRTKLKNICEAHDLTYTFIKNSYPIKLIIRPIKGVGEQMSMLETASEDSYISPDAYLLFTMKDGVLVYRMSKTFTIEDALFGKIKNIFKNMHSYYCQFFFRELINKRKHELYELHINEQEAEIVRLIFDKYVYEGYGAQRIATYLNNAGYRARSGKCWHPGSLRGMVGNLTYMGVLRCGDARSELMPELQIIPQEEFEAAQRIREDRSAHAAEEAEHHVPLRTRGQALLSNNVYCGHCGARLALTTSRKWRKLSDGTLDDTLRIRYTCYGKLRKQTDCTGQTGYTMHILDEIIDKMVRQIFSRLRGIPKEQLITSRYAKETAERKNHLQTLQAERDKAEKDLLALKTEILAVIKGESAFPKDTLAEMIAAQEKKHTELETLCEEASAELERNAELMANVSQLYEELISYADLYDSASFEAKKMIVSQLIRRVEVYRGYQIHVDFNFDLAQYLENRDELAC